MGQTLGDWEVDLSVNTPPGCLCQLAQAPWPVAPFWQTSGFSLPIDEAEGSGCLPAEPWGYCANFPWPSGSPAAFNTGTDLGIGLLDLDGDVRTEGSVGSLLPATPQSPSRPLRSKARPPSQRESFGWELVRDTFEERETEVLTARDIVSHLVEKTGKPRKSLYSTVRSVLTTYATFEKLGKFKWRYHKCHSTRETRQNVYYVRNRANPKHARRKGPGAALARF